MKKTHCLSWLIVVLFVLSVSTACGNDGEDEPDVPGGSEVSETNLKKLITENVSVTGQYADFKWTFKIESTLHNVLPNSKIRFGVGHGSLGDYFNVSYENKAYSYDYSFRSKTYYATFENPFWMYYAFGIVTPDKDALAYSEIYYNSYVALKEKGLSNLSSDEKELYNSLIDELEKLERTPMSKYSPTIQVEIDDISYCVRSF